jgi:hypothetical protein
MPLERVSAREKVPTVVTIQLSVVNGTVVVFTCTSTNRKSQFLVQMDTAVVRPLRLGTKRGYQF